MARLSGTLSLDAGSIIESNISSSTRIDADKMQHVYKPWTNFATAIGSAPSTREEMVFVATQTGTIRGFHAVCNDTGSSSSMTFDLKKNGTTCLSSVITITDSTTDKQTQDGTLSVTSFVAGDILSIAITVSSSTGVQGAFAWADVEENNAP